MSSAPAVTPVRSLTYDDLKSAVSGSAAAFRILCELQPSGGPGAKVFPSTYSGGVYARERRIVNGKESICVLLDSVQSQANRLEQCLLRAVEEKAISLPIVVVEFPANEFPEIGRITTLDAPHRIADAILRDSTLDVNGTQIPFRETTQGKAFAAATQRNATALFDLCPTALIFGCWDSTGSQGGLGNKFARALVSEIVGFDAVFGTKTSSRIDPLGIKRIEVYKAGDGWTAELAKADKESNGDPIKYVGKSGKGNPSALNHGNVVPSLSKRDDEKEFIGGGVTISKAVLTTVLSLPALRRLRFPDASGKYSLDRDRAAQTVLAAVALTATALQNEQGYDLRSRCLLLPVQDNITCELVVSANPGTEFQLDSKQCIAALSEALKAAREHKLEWRSEPLPLQPQTRLLELISKSRAAVEVEEAADAGPGN
jgi:CRISPR-associated protein Csb1